MRTLLVALILMSVAAAAEPDAPSTAPSAGDAAVAPAPRYPDAIEVFHCDFGAHWDQDYDRWPDGWTRLRSATYPSYIQAKIDEDPQVADGRVMRIDMDGGGAAVYSPPLKINAIFSYVVQARIKTDKLLHDEAYFTITFYDAKNQALEEYASQHIGGTSAWRRLQINPVAPVHENVDHAVIGLRVEPTTQADIHGAVSFADIWVGRLPRMTFKTDRRDGVYLDPDRPKLTCAASGFDADTTRVVFQLLDCTGAVVDRHEQPLDIAQTSTGRVKSGAAESTPKVIVGAASYSPPIRDVGYYRAQVAMLGKSGLVHQREVTLAIVRPEQNPRAGEFGWTLPGGDHPLSLADLSEVVSEAGVNWVKFPVWGSPGENARSERLVWFAERLRLQHIELVGMLYRPPPDVLKKLGDMQHPLAAQIFSAEPELWYPSLEPLLTALSLKVKWWQLGLDNDTGFVGYPRATDAVNQFRRCASRFGQQVNIAIGWSWLNSQPRQPQAWDAVSISADPPLTHEELTAYLAASAGVKTRRWVALEPLPKSEYPLETRVNDLALRMLTAKIGEADAIFIPDVFNSDRGLMNDDGSVGELFVPWRTMALAISGSKYLGSVSLPGGSSNRLLEHDGKVTMVIWNDRPTTERLYLGSDVRQTDLWGRSRELATERGEQVIHVSTSPTLLTGLNAPVLRWRMIATLAESQWPSLFGVTRSNALVVKNTFGQGISGHIRMTLPEGWKTADHDMNFKLAANETLEEPFQVQVPLDAATGKQEIRFEFDIMADRRYEFTLTRTIDLGQADVYATASAHLTEQGALEVEQRVTNDTDTPVSFKCFLYAPGRLPIVTQVVELSHGTDVKNYRLPDGASLAGKTLQLRADEIGGQRILNYRFTVQQ